VEIKCQLDATEVFIADLIACSTCFGHHYAHHHELKSIIRRLLPVVFRAVVFKLQVWCGAEGYVSGLQDAAASYKMKSYHHLMPNGHYMGRTAQLTSRCCILYIYSTSIPTEYFKHAA